MEDSRARERAELIARDLIEYISSIDYQKYFDAMGRPGSRGGDKEKQFSDFSIRAVDAAQVPWPVPTQSDMHLAFCSIIEAMHAGEYAVQMINAASHGAHAHAACSQGHEASIVQSEPAD